MATGDAERAASLLAKQGCVSFSVVPVVTDAGARYRTVTGGCRLTVLNLKQEEVYQELTH